MPGSFAKMFNEISGAAEESIPSDVAYWTDEYNADSVPQPVSANLTPEEQLTLSKIYQQRFIQQAQPEAYLPPQGYEVPEGGGPVGLSAYDPYAPNADSIITGTRLNNALSPDPTYPEKQLSNQLLLERLRTLVPGLGI